MIRLIILCLLLTGCMSVEKAEKVMRAHPKELAELCADCFPVKPSEVKIDTRFIKGKDSIRVDTVEADCPDGTKIKKKCPPCNNKTPDTLIITKNIKLRDTAFETVLINERGEAIKSRDGWRKACLWGWGVIGVYLLIVFIRKRLP